MSRTESLGTLWCKDRTGLGVRNCNRPIRVAKLPRRGGDMIRPEQAVEARDSLVDTLLQTNKQEFLDILKPDE